MQTPTDPARLLQLAPWRKMRTGFGYLLRHYWMPATRLTLKRVVKQDDPSGGTSQSERLFTRILLRCDADQCVSRDELLECNEPLIQFSRPSASQEICYYNRSEQTYRVRAIPGVERWPENECDARNQAFLQQPLLNPLLPIPVGFQWHIRNEDAYLDYTLESAVPCGKMTVLTIRREGEFHLNAYYRDGTLREHRFKIHRQGVTVYALERAMILEDRAHDRVSGPSEIDGLQTWTTQTTLQSELP